MANVRYTPEEEEAMRRLFPTAPRAEVLAALPRHSWHTIQKAAFRRGLARPRRQHNSKWEGAPVAMLRARYCAEGAVLLAAELGFSLASIHTKAHQEGLVYKAKRRPAKRAPRRATAAEKAAREARLLKLYPPRTQPKPKLPIPVKPLKTVSVAKALPAPGVAKKAPGTPNLHVQKAESARKAKPKVVPVTADQIRALAPNHPARWAYTKAARLGPDAAHLAFHEAMQAIKQAA